MTQIEELMPVVLGKGILLRMFIDHSKPVGDIDHNWNEATCDGKEDSQPLTVPLHWHRDHDEIMEVLEGRMKFTLDGKEKVLSAGDPTLLIPRGHVHSITSFKGERARFTEKTVPAGDFKALFFQDLYQDGNPSLTMALRAFYDGDTYIPLPGNIRLLDSLFITIVGFLAKAFVPPKLAGVKKKGEGPEFPDSVAKPGFFM